MTQQTQSTEEDVTYLSDYILNIAENKAVVHEGPLRDEIIKQMAVIFDKKTSGESNIVVAFEDQAQTMGLFASVWSYLRDTKNEDVFNRCGFFYSVHAEAVTARDIVLVTDAISQLSDSQKPLSCVLVKIESADSTKQSEYLSELLRIAKNYGVRVVTRVEQYKDHLQELKDS